MEFQLNCEQGGEQEERRECQACRVETPAVLGTPKKVHQKRAKKLQGL